MQQVVYQASHAFLLLVDLPLKAVVLLIKGGYNLTLPLLLILARIPFAFIVPRVILRLVVMRTP